MRLYWLSQMTNQSLGLPWATLVFWALLGTLLKHLGPSLEPPKHRQGPAWLCGPIWDFIWGIGDVFKSPLKPLLQEGLETRN